MVDLDLGHAGAASREIDRYEPMHLAVEADFLQDHGAVRLQSAPVVVELDSGQTADQPVGDAARQLPHHGRVAAPPAPAADDVEATTERLDEPGDVGRVVLSVGVQRKDDVSPREIEPGGHGRGLSEIPAQLDDARADRAAFGGGEDFLQYGERAVFRAVVHVNDLRGSPEGSEHAANLGIEEVEVVFLVEHRDDDGDLGTLFRLPAGNDRSRRIRSHSLRSGVSLRRPAAARTNTTG